MTNMNKKALVIGATGLVGKALVKQLQVASEFESVTVVVRKELDEFLSLIHISEPTRHFKRSRMPSSA